jgi:hypothetical protein
VSHDPGRTRMFPVLSTLNRLRGSREPRLDRPVQEDDPERLPPQASDPAFLRQLEARKATTTRPDLGHGFVLTGRAILGHLDAAERARLRRWLGQHRN